MVPGTIVECISTFGARHLRRIVYCPFDDAGAELSVLLLGAVVVSLELVLVFVSAGGVTTVVVDAGVSGAVAVTFVVLLTLVGCLYAI